MRNFRNLWIIEKITLLVYLFFSRLKLFSVIYYFFFNKSFQNEFYGILRGKVAFNMREVNYFQLRRNIHRIEKGLLMKPRRDIFAKDYIIDTVTLFHLAIKVNEVNKEEEIQWAFDVLTKYFEVVRDDPIILRARNNFNNSANVKRFENNLYIPYCRTTNKNDIPDYKSLLNLSIQRRSVRWYLDKPVPRDLIDDALKIANFAPSACNRQPYYYKIIDDLELVRKVAKIPLGTGGYGHNIKTLALLIGDLSAFRFERDRHLIYIDASLSAMAFMYALETLNLSSCPINWGEVPKLESRMRKLVKLKPYERIIMLISIGFADLSGKVAYSKKKSMDELRKYE